MLVGDAEKAAEAKPDAVVIPIGVAAEKLCIGLVAAMRRFGLSVEMGFRGNMKKRLSCANEIGAAYAVIVGDDELAAGKALLRNLATGKQTPQPFSLFGLLPLTGMDGVELDEPATAGDSYISDLLLGLDGKDEE